MAFEPKLPHGMLERMRDAAKAKHLTHNDISEIACVPVATVQKLMRGATDPQFMTMYKVVAALGLSIDYILSGEGEQTHDWSSSLPALSADQRRIPIFDIAASAGDGASVLLETPSAFATFPADYLASLGTSDQLQIIRITGDSMEPEYRSGDQVMVDRSQNKLREGVHVIRLDQELVLKRIQLLGGGGVRLISNNPKYQPEEKRLDEAGFEVIGRVVWTGRAL